MRFPRTALLVGRIGKAVLALSSLVLAGCTATLGFGEEDGPADDDPGVFREAEIDPGRVVIHRLNNTEYNNTVRDLLGTSLAPASDFLAEEGNLFDNNASSLGMTTSQYEAYLQAAEDLMEDALADSEVLARFLTCTPKVAADPCARQIIETFGMRIYRRPLEAEEVQRAMGVYDEDLARFGDGTESIALSLQAMLSAAKFLYRIEYDPDPTSLEPHGLSPYELASRLSYLLWSSMPDDALFELAASGELADPAVLETTVDLLLSDEKSKAFVEGFSGQWLDTRNLVTHSVTAEIFSTYTVSLADAMMAESNLWFEEFLQQDHPVSDWFTADFNYVNDELAAHYGMTPPGSGTELVRVEVATDQRQGFLGLASFLTQSSMPSRTSPTLRGFWVLEELLCEHVPPPPGVIPDLESSADPTEDTPVGAENVRERLAQHRSDPGCATCHKLFDPIGLGLEEYDGIGRLRESYGNGDSIDPAGVLPDGTVFSGANELGAILGNDPRFRECLAKKLYSYALGREVESFDDPSLAHVQDGWEERDPSLRSLLKEIVLSEAFRFRRGESE